MSEEKCAPRRALQMFGVRSGYVSHMLLKENQNLLDALFYYGNGLSEFHRRPFVALRTARCCHASDIVDFCDCYVPNKHKCLVLEMSGHSRKTSEELDRCPEIPETSHEPCCRNTTFFKKEKKNSLFFFIINNVQMVLAESESANTNRICVALGWKSDCRTVFVTAPVIRFHPMLNDQIICE